MIFTLLIFFTMSLSRSRSGLQAVKTPGFDSLLNFDWAALVFALAGDFEGVASANRTRLGQCCRALLKNGFVTPSMIAGIALELLDVSSLKSAS